MKISYSQYNFLRSIDSQKNTNIINKEIDNCIIYTDPLNDLKIYYKFLEWDTDYFGIKTVKIFYIDDRDNERSDVSDSINKLLIFLKKQTVEYLFFEVPSEDISMIHALGLSKFSLIETRLHYFNDKIQDYNYPKRFDVREATIKDITNLRRVSSMMRNVYDRFHADPIMSNKKADAFLATYVEEAINGFSDIVLVPNAENLPSDSFLTADYQDENWITLDKKVSKMVLSAVSSETNRGWYLKLISEMTYLLKNKGVEVIHMNTQCTNRAVLNVWSKLGYKLGRVTHVFSISI